VVGVEVGDEDGVEVEQADRAQQLALRAFAAVEQQLLTAAPEQQRGQAAPGARDRARRAGEEDRQIHAANGSGGHLIGVVRIG
jgi:hypothetical protein